MKWDTIQVQDFDLAATLGSGQVFHWNLDEGVFSGLVGREHLQVSQPDAATLVVSPGKTRLATHYLGLDHELKRIWKTLPKKDKHLTRALKFCPGLRILRQPKWECLATFITSSLKQVAHIRQISLLLRDRFGETITLENGTQHQAYPTPEALADAGEEALRRCGLGYRAKFLHQTAGLVAGGYDLEAITALDDDAALAKLCELPGVGPKIAQCTLLFAYERLGVFPIDVWIERALRELYFADTEEKITSGQLRDFALKHFGPYRGYAQQWLFHHARTSGMFKRRRDGV